MHTVAAVVLCPCTKVVTAVALDSTRISLSTVIYKVNKKIVVVLFPDITAAVAVASDSTGIALHT